jgi:flagellar biosynthesis chaperone FliJ
MKKIIDDLETKLKNVKKEKEEACEKIQNLEKEKVKLENNLNSEIDKLNNKNKN